MAVTLRFPLPRADLVLSVLAAVSVVAIVGVAVFVLRLQCLGGTCFSVTDPVFTSSIEAQAAAAEVAQEPPAAPGPAPDATARAAEDLIAETFARLAAMPEPEFAAPASREVVAEIPVPPVATERVSYAARSPLLAHTPDPSRDRPERWWWPGSADPVFPAPAPRVESPGDDNAVVASTDAAPAEEIVDDTVSSGPAGDDPVQRVVAGQGVNVRSGPSMSNSTLFALRGGAEVTLTGRSERGWLELRDADGRAGWAYSDFLLNP